MSVRQRASLELTVNRFTIVVGGMIAGAVVGMLVGGAALQPAAKAGDKPVRLGNFSVSLPVKDLEASRAFYEKLGFKVFVGSPKQHFLIMQNETSTIGLHQGGVEKISLTYNPGWDRSCNTLADFDDVRELQKTLKAKGIEPTVAADDAGSGPAFMVLTDPDGNPVLIDQHVAAPKK